MQMPCTVSSTKDSASEASPGSIWEKLSIGTLEKSSKMPGILTFLRKAESIKILVYTSTLFLAG